MGDLKEFSKYDVIRPKWKYGRTRFNFFLSDGQKKCLLEVRLCTLARDEIALFSDTSTKRGRRHPIDLIEALKRVYSACVIFLIQKKDAKAFTPNYITDVKFGNLHSQAVAEGIKVYTHSLEFTDDEIVLREKVEFDLSYARQRSIDHEWSKGDSYEVLEW